MCGRPPRTGRWRRQDRADPPTPGQQEPSRLANRNPVCRRPPDRPCHADVSLEIANSLSERLIKAEIERGNDAHTGLTVHRRHGKAAPSEQPVTMTLGNLAVLFTGNNVNL